MRKLSLMWRKNKPDLVAVLRGGFPAFVWQRRPPDWNPADGIPVFCYHRADPAVVDQDLTFLTENGYRTCTVEECLNPSAASKHEKRVLLTVDDGAHDLYSVLYPALRKYGMHAVAFVAPAFHQDQYDLPDDCRPCTWSELKEMNDSGCVDVQAHTWSHRYIPNWPEPLDLVSIDPDYSRSIQRQEYLELAEDLKRAKQVLEERLNKQVQHLAFPMYEGTQEAIRLALACGYGSCWWGTVPRRPLNGPVASRHQMVRLDAQWLRRLPGANRRTLISVAEERFTCSRRSDS